MAKTKKKGVKKLLKCPKCRCKKHNLIWYVKHLFPQGATSHANTQLPGFKKCRNAFHGAGNWATGK